MSDLTNFDDLREFLREQQAEIAELKIALSATAEAAAAHLKNKLAADAEIARLRRGLEDACFCLGLIRFDKDARYAAKGHDKARAVLEQKS